MTDRAATGSGNTPGSDDRDEVAALRRSQACTNADRTARDDDRLAARADEQAAAGDQHAADRGVAAAGRDDAGTPKRHRG